MAMVLSAVFSVLFIASNLLAVDAQQQAPLLFKEGKLDLIYELKKAEIIPTVIDEFTPLLSVSVTWKNATADYGNTINPHMTKNQPDVALINSDPEIWSDKKDVQLTLAMTDPDAPSRDNPEWSEFCHWIVTDVALTEPDDDEDHDDGDDGDHSDGTARLKKRMLDVMPYKPPGPPAKTGKHRYVFVALVPKNGTTDSLDLKKPGDRRRWGYDHERNGLRMWAEEMGLQVVGANFIYAQNDEQ